MNRSCSELGSAAALGRAGTFQDSTFTELYRHSSPILVLRTFFSAASDNGSSHCPASCESSSLLIPDLISRA